MPRRALIDQARLLEVLRLEVELIVDSASGADPDARVPTAPGLTVWETVRHLGSVFRLVVSWLRDGRRPGEWQREPIEGETVERYLLSGYDALAAELSRRDPTAEAATWWPEDQTSGFWRRRMAHETSIHRTDVQSAAGLEITAIDDDVALDGIDEVLTLWFGHRLGVLGVSGTRVSSVGVRSGARSWIARAGPSYTRAQLVDADVTGLDAQVSGTPMRVYLWLWGRLATGAVQTDGDEDAVAQLWALLRLATR